MSRSKWTIRNYNTYLREFKRATGGSHKTAQAAYRIMRDRAGRSLRGVDVKRHPRMVKDAYKAGLAATRRVERRVKLAAEVEAAEQVLVTSAEQWIDNYEEWSDDYDIVEEEWESTADYEEEPA